MAKTTKKLKDLEVTQYEGANWNEMEDDFTQAFYEQNLSQFWRPEDISLQPDLNVWNVLSDEIKEAYAKNLLVLTFLIPIKGILECQLLHALWMIDSIKEKQC